jgi:hypothetical protein
MRKEFKFLESVEGNDSEAFCTLCSSKFSISNGGRHGIRQHLKTKKHIIAAGKLRWMTVRCQDEEAKLVEKSLKSVFSCWQCRVPFIR